MTIQFAEGIYKGKVTKQGIGKAGTGNPQFYLSFTPIGKVDPADAEKLIECPPYERTVFRVITDKTIEYFIADLDRLGYKGDTFDALQPGAPNYHDFTGQVIEVRCEHDSYQGKEKERWSLNFGGSYEAKPIEQSDMKKLNAMFGKYLKGGGTKNGAKAAKPAAAHAEEVI